jgi:hypothetical protein
MTGLLVLTAVLIVLSIMAGLITYKVQNDDAVLGFAALVAGLIITSLTFGYNWFGNFHNDHWAVCTVISKDRGGQDGSYRIYTDTCGTLANKDAMLRGKFRSADMWQQIQPNHIYMLHIAGARVPLFSHFPNVFEVKPVK